ncbi:MAG: hypothetical protein KGQ59_04645 [Bdellovibrionales bacterium]|nr:hypothetical protein [Bdellovibrionales bacterium]
MKNPIYYYSRRIALCLFSSLAVALCGWLAIIPGQAEEPLFEPQNIDRKPVTCTDAAGIIYERGTPGFERCLIDMNRNEPEQAAREAETQESHKGIKKRKGGDSKTVRSASPTPTPTSTEKTQ